MPLEEYYNNALEVIESSDVVVTYDLDSELHF